MHEAGVAAEGARTVEMNMIGELNMYKEAGIKPNFSDIARRYGKDRHTVASYWKADGSDPGDARRNRKGSFEPHIEEVRAKAQLPGVTKRVFLIAFIFRKSRDKSFGFHDDCFAS